METNLAHPVLLPDQGLDSLREIPELVIAEIAGRDSVAAIVQLTRKRPAVTILPTIVYTATEYGDFSAPYQAVEYVRQLLPDTTILDPVMLFDPTLWAALNARFATEMSARYPGWSPCAACHLYVHLARAPLSMALGNAPIVSGERDTHEGRYKLSQTPESINAAIAVLAEFGIELIQPIREFHENSRIEELVGPGWAEGARQLSCVHTGSYKQADGTFHYDPALWKNYLDGFFVPAARAVLTEMRSFGASDQHPDWARTISRLVSKD